jgi:ribosomal protein L20A (L18A)
MDIMSMVSGILATQDERKQLQNATTVLNATAKKNAAQTLLAEQASPANPGPGVGGNLDVTA